MTDEPNTCTCGGATVGGRQIHMHNCPVLAAERENRQHRESERRRRRRREVFDPRWRWDLSVEAMICLPLMLATAIVAGLIFAGVIT